MGKCREANHLRNFFEERTMCSCPASMVDATTEPVCDCEENVPSARPSCGHAAELFATPISTPTDSPSVPNTERDSRSDEATLLDHLQSSDCRVQHLQKLPGLPEFEYPGPVFQTKGTFIHTDLARPFSLDEFEDRNLQSCPGSVVAGMVRHKYQQWLKPPCNGMSHQWSSCIRTK